MKMPLLCNFPKGSALIVGTSKAAFEWFRELSDFGMYVQVAVYSDEERRRWKRTGLPCHSSLIEINSRWLWKWNNKVDLIIAAREDPGENDQILREASEKLKSIRFRISVTPSLYANVSEPIGQFYRGFTVTVEGTNEAEKLNRTLMQRLDSIIEKEAYENKYLLLFWQSKLDNGDSDQSHKEVKPLGQLLDLEISKIKNASGAYTANNCVVVGVIDDPYMILEAQKYIEHLKEKNPEYEFVLKVLSPPSYSFMDGMRKGSNYDYLLKKSKLDYHTLSKALLKQEIDMAFVDLMYPLNETPTVQGGVSFSLVPEIEQSPVMIERDSHVILNTQGITDILRIPWSVSFVHDEFDITPQLNKFCEKVARWKPEFYSEKMGLPLSEYLKSVLKTKSKEFITCSQANLDICGLTDNELKEMGFSIIHNGFASPIGFKEFGLVCPKLVGKSLIPKSYLAPSNKHFNSNLDYICGKLEMETFLYRDWLNYVENEHYNPFLFSLICDFQKNECEATLFTENYERSSFIEIKDRLVNKNSFHTDRLDNSVGELMY